MSESRQNTPGVVRIYSVVLSVGICCSLAIVTTYEVTRPIIERNRIALRQAAILEVLPEATTIQPYRFIEATQTFESVLGDANNQKANDQNATENEMVFAGFDRHGELAGLAIETHGMGYQDIIRMLYAYSFDKQAIVGTRVLESRETPGLGDRIETDEAFLRNFVELDVSLNPDGTQLANPIESVKPGEKTAAWQIDGITGATISSRAIAEMVGRSAAIWIPRVQSGHGHFVLNRQKE